MPKKYHFLFPVVFWIAIQFWVVAVTDAAVTPASSPAMDFQPPADADAFVDFVPPHSAEIPLAMAVPRGASPEEALAASDGFLEIGISPEENSAVSLNNGQLGIILDKGALTQPVSLSIASVAQREPPAAFATGGPGIDAPGDHLGAGALFRFRLHVQDERGTAVRAFAGAARLVVDLREYGIDLGKTGGTFYLAYENELDPGEWLEVPLQLHGEGGLISAEVTHFSNWEAGWRPEAWALEWSPPVVNEFTGAASYQYPFQIPPGRNGLRPQAGLSYSSASLRGAIRQTSLGTVASGWSLSDISITRTGVKNGASAWTYPDTYRLTLNGSGGRLIEGDTQHGVTRFFVEDMPGLRVFNYGGRFWDAEEAGNTYWIVKDGSGTVYRLGFTDDAVSYQETQATGGPVRAEILAWHVDTVTDPFGNQINYAYLRPARYENWGFWCPWGGNCWSDVWTYNSQVSDAWYNFDAQATPLPPVHDGYRLIETGATAVSHISFLYGSSDQRLTEVQIFHGSGTRPVRKYVIDAQTVQVDNPYKCREYNGGGHATLKTRTRIVNWIEEQGYDIVNDSWVSLPRTLFEYERHHHFTHLGDGLCFQYDYLSAYENGYGGRVELAYVSDNRTGGNYANCVGAAACDPAVYPTMGYNYSVSLVVQHDRINNPVSLQYGYGNRCYNELGSCPLPETDATMGVIGGYGTVTVTAHGFAGESLWQRVTFYHQDEAKFGRSYQTDLRDGSGTLRQRTETSYQVDHFAAGSARFTHAAGVTERHYDAGEGSTVMGTRVTYAYEPAKQGGAQYGNLTAVAEYDDLDAGAVPYRTTRSWYFPNTTNWIVNKAAATAVYAGSSSHSDEIQSAIWTYYDLSDDITAPPVRGATTQVEQFVENVACGNVPGCTHAHRLVTRQMDYDAYGNLRQTVQNNDYALKAFDANGSLLQFTPPAAASAYTTTISYDADYHLYPVFTRNAKDEMTSFIIYGFNGALDGFQAIPGLLKEVTDPADITTRYEYDPFGRLHAVYDGDESGGAAFAGFGDADPWNGDPVTRYRYWDNLWNNATRFLDPAGAEPFLITSEQRPGSFPAPDNAAGGFAYELHTFYDGWGRPIQERTPWSWIEGFSLSQEIIRTTAYDARGQVACETVPNAVPFYEERGKVWPDSPFVDESCGDAALEQTLTTYDALGRPSTITAPDGSKTQFNYYIRDHVIAGSDDVLRIEQVIDANSHVVNRLHNGRGQLVQVREYTGTGSDADPYLDYATTTYTYDLNNNLRSVTDAAGNVTEMTYDALGRKNWMDDPDMGEWEYLFDAAGNLVNQKDARGNHLCFEYDALGRLLAKRHDNQEPIGSSDACNAADALLAGYTYYDSGVGQVGQLQEIRWPDADNRETFIYDTLGRLAAHRRWIDGELYEMGYPAYDALQRPLSFIYPDGESVAVSYDHEGENGLVVGGSVLVSDVRYNARGQMTTLVRSQPNVPDTRYFYYGAAVSQGGGIGDGNFRLREIRHAGGQMPDFRYQYDQVGNITRLETVQNQGNDIQQFQYDALNRLQWAEIAAEEIAYAYDPLGNVRERAVTEGSVQTDLRSYQYPESGPAAVRPHAATVVTRTLAGQPESVWRFGYDENGNMKGRIDASGSYTQTFDVENRLVTVTAADGRRTRFAYDADGIRVLTIRDDGVTIHTPFPNYEVEARLLPAVSLTAEHGQVGPYDPVVLEWSSARALTCTAGGMWSGEKAYSGRLTLPAPGGGWNIGTHLFTLTCENEAGPVTAQATVQLPAPSVSLMVVENDGPANGYLFPQDAVPLAWTGDHVTTCAANGPAGSTWNGLKLPQGSESVAPPPQGWLPGSYHFTITCHNGRDNISASVTVSVHDPLPRPLLAAATAPPDGADRELGCGREWEGICFWWENGPVPPATTYSLYLGVREEGPFSEVIAGDLTEAHYLLQEVTTGTFYYVVTVSNSYGESAYSNWAACNEAGCEYDLGPGFSQIEGPVVAWGSAVGKTADSASAAKTPATKLLSLPGDVVIVRSTYSLAGQAIAVHVNGDPHGSDGLFYLYGDHLGSASAMTNATGAPVGGVTRYYPFGDYRPGSGPNEISDRGFTGHRHNDDLGMIYMNARYYVPGIGRFASADTIVPDPANPQSWNRYSYVLDNPLRFYDPTGHFAVGSDEEGYNQDSEIYQYFTVLGWSEEDILDLFRIWEYQYPDWWNVLLEAEIGDYLDYIDYGGSNLFAHFGTDNNCGLQIEVSWDLIDEWVIDPRLDQIFFGYWDHYYEDMGTDWSIDALRIWSGPTATDVLLVRQGHRGSGSGYGFVAGTGVFRDSNNPMPEKMDIGGALRQTWGWFVAAGAAFASPADGPVGELVLSGAGIVDTAHALYENHRDRSRLSQYAYPHH